jgi:3-isopropylmalate/(R)-2-methylmalate dehydratase small subunit
MKPLTRHEGLVVAIPAANVDTDILVPKQYLKRVERDGLAGILFDRWRYLDRGDTGDDPYVDCTQRTPDPAFALNQPRHAGATILLAGANFGCGSSREQAVWALAQWGIRVIVAVSFGDIFFNNSHANGLLPVVLPEAALAELMQRAARPGWRLVVDLPQQRIEDPVRGDSWPFEIDPFRKRCLIDGADTIALTLQHEAAIAAFELRHGHAQPWLAPPFDGFVPPRT